MNAELVPIERIERAILLIREHKVMRCGDPAVLYAVETKALNRAVKRDIDRFPADFMFQLAPDEQAALRRHFGSSITGRSAARRSRFGTSKRRGGRRYDRQFRMAFDAMRELMTAPDPKPRRRIGFGAEEER